MDYYRINAARSMAGLHTAWTGYLTAEAGRELDVGAGSSRDAYRMVRKGCDVVADLPSYELRFLATKDEPRVRWNSDTLPCVTTLAFVLLPADSGQRRLDASSIRATANCLRDFKRCAHRTASWSSDDERWERLRSRLPQAKSPLFKTSKDMSLSPARARRRRMENILDAKNDGRGLLDYKRWFAQLGMNHRSSNTSFQKVAMLLAVMGLIDQGSLTRNVIHPTGNLQPNQKIHY